MQRKEVYVKKSGDNWMWNKIIVCKIFQKLIAYCNIIINWSDINLFIHNKSPLSLWIREYVILNIKKQKKTTYLN